ncbi:MAG: hypothetical protein ACSLEN_13090 [Candidatus Malihini olakiniferum]
MTTVEIKSNYRLDIETVAVLLLGAFYLLRQGAKLLRRGESLNTNRCEAQEQESWVINALQGQLHYPRLWTVSTATTYSTTKTGVV